MSFMKSPLIGLPPSLIVSAESEIGKGWFFLKWKVTNLEARERRDLRLRQSPHAQEKFRQAMIAAAPAWLAKKIRSDERAWEAHHALPLAFGGGPQHRALAHDVAHACIHGFVKEQMTDWAPRESRVILIPVRKGLIWTSETILPAFKERCLCFEWSREHLLMLPKPLDTQLRVARLG